MECSCHDYQDKIKSTSDVIDLIKNAAIKKEPLSLTRFSHAEITYLNWDRDRWIVKAMKEFKEYNGVDKPLKSVAYRLLKSLKMTTIAGFIPNDYVEFTTAPRDKTNGWEWYKRTKTFLHNNQIFPKTICSVWVTQEMIYNDNFWEMLSGYSVALVGRRAKEAVPYFQEKGVNVTTSVSLDGIDKVYKVKDYLKNQQWDIAIISAGIPATLLTPRLANETDRIVLDFGHALDRIIDGENFDFHNLVKDWEKKKSRKWKRS